MRVAGVRTLLIMAATLMTAAVVSISGIVAWVGLLVPHMARMLVGPSFPTLLPVTLVMGGGYLLLVDDVCRTVARIDIPWASSRPYSEHRSSFSCSPGGGTDGSECRGCRLWLSRLCPAPARRSFCSGRGEILCLLGPNGVGKTTLLRCLLGAQRVQGGRITIAGRDVRTLAARELARQVAYVPQAANLGFPFSVVEMVLMGRTPYIRLLAVPTRADYDMALRALDTVGICHLAPRLYTEISGGERQLTLMARALVQQASAAAR